MHAENPETELVCETPDSRTTTTQYLGVYHQLYSVKADLLGKVEGAPERVDIE
jgi:hypothetical protein